MIDEDELRFLQTKFETERQSNQSHYRELEKLRRQFVFKFPPHKITYLSLDDYVEGKGSQDSFCYWVEWKTSELGRIQGSPSARFGVFYDKKNKRFKTTGRFKNENEAIIFLREKITRLLEAGQANDLKAIRKIEISPMFKGKILFLYYPDQFLNVFSEDHIDHFLREIGLPLPNDNLDVLTKRELLLKFKASDEIMSNWTTNEFMRFLYDAWRPPPRSSKVPLALRRYVDAQNFPPAEKTSAEFISLEIGVTLDSTDRLPKRSSNRIDFEKQNQRNKRIGDQGEDIVYWAERKWLMANGRQNLAQNVDRVCRKDAGAGYDIKSFELDGRVKHIEVKSTTSKPPADSSEVFFHLSAREFQQAKDLPNFYLYIVFDVKSPNPKIWQIPDPAKLNASRLRLQPSAYHARLMVQFGEITKK